MAFIFKFVYRMIFADNSLSHPLFPFYFFLSDVVSSLFCAWRCISFIMFIIHDGSVVILWESAAFIKYHFIKLVDCSWHKFIHNIFKENISCNQLVR